MAKWWFLQSSYFLLLTGVIDKGYIRSNRYPVFVWAEEMRKHRLEALVPNIKFQARLQDSLNASSARTIQDNDLY
ncbi:hypothetical protein BWO97_08590 [Legionella pneumophila subsp. pneumophila ATCC 43290]|nr:hypothetical protein BWO97_08590 [Legionella pneumophila subsp. pneumophila ATCC 43290]